MDQIVINRPETQGVEQDALGLLKLAKSISVINVPTHAAAGEFLREIATREKTVENLFAQPKKAAHEAHKSIVAAEKSLLSPLGEARKIVSGEILRFESEQRRKAEEEQKRLEEESRKQAEERLLDEAESAERSGDRALADELLGSNVTASVVRVEPELAQTEGISSRRTYRAEVTDMLELLRWVIAHPEIGLGLVLPNQGSLNGMARAQKHALKIPGVRVVEDRGLSVRS